MRRLVWVLLPALLGSCNEKSVGFAAVAIRPVYGWSDGCTPLRISGHGFASGATAKIGATEIADLACDPAAGCDEGFQLFGTAPPATTDVVGTFLDVAVKSGGETSTIPLAYYYVQCPGLLIEGVGPTEAVTPGTVITMQGCGLDSSTLLAKVGDAAAVPLTSVCSSATVSFTAPDLPAGAGYTVSLVNANGDVIFPAACDTADTAAQCDVPPVLTY
jgi:hypothetical protein